MHDEGHETLPEGRDVRWQTHTSRTLVHHMPACAVRSLRACMLRAVTSTTYSQHPAGRIVFGRRQGGPSGSQSPLLAAEPLEVVGVGVLTAVADLYTPPAADGGAAAGGEALVPVPCAVVLAWEAWRPVCRTPRSARGRAPRVVLRTSGCFEDIWLF